MKVYARSGEAWNVNVGRFISASLITGGALVLATTSVAPVVTSWWPGQETHDQYIALPSAGTNTSSVFVPAPDEESTPLPTVTELASEASPPPAPARSSAAPPPVVPAFAPTRISIPKLKLDASVIQKPTVNAWSAWLGKNVASFGVAEKGDRDPTTGKTIDPMRVAVWWSSGPKVGALGKGGQMAIILGHTHSSSYGIFNELGKLKPGDKINLASSKPKVASQLSVLKTVSNIPKSDESALNQVLQSPPKGATVALITCSGLVKRTIDDSRSHEHNTVVFLGSPVQTPGS